MSVTLGMMFAAVRHARADAVLRFVRQLPGLSEGSAADADVGVGSQGRFLVLRVRLSDVLVSAAILDRIQFWCARAGGRAMAAQGVATECERRLREAELVRRGADATRLDEILGPALAEQCGLRSLASEPDLLPPVLHLQIGGPGWSGVLYDGAARALFLPTPLAPAVGDPLIVQLETIAPDREVARSAARVTTVVQDEPDAVTGFTAKLEGDSDAADRVLSVTCSGSRFREARSSQRFPAAGRVAVAGAEARLVDLSHGGAFISTPDPPDVGEDVEVRVRLPNDATLQAKATVVHANPAGMGVRFQLDPADDSALASLVTSITARRPHVLVVDDDALTRRMLADGFHESGYDVLTAPDADFALHTLTDQILTLDLLVTDVRMPGMGGERLVETIRRVGGESELPIVVVSGAVDVALESRLRAAGADTVLSKSLGVEAIVSAATDAVGRRRSGAGAAALPLERWGDPVA